MPSKKYSILLNKFIPGGSHTYSRGADQFSENAPEILLKGNGQFVYDIAKKKYLDYGMGLRSVAIGYNEKKINKSAIKQIENGINLTRPSVIELKAAQEFVRHFDSVEMVKFTKNGSTAVTAAVKLARGYTKKNLVARCYDHPFFSYDDWFIGSTAIKLGIPKVIQKLTLTFKYNDIQSLKDLVRKYKNDLSCVVLEPSTINCPYIDKKETHCCGQRICSRDFKKNNFLIDVQNVCKENNIVFILDEMITGFRWNLYGAQKMYNLNPDISTFGKAMANGFPLAAVAGKSKIMELGGISKKNQERLFLLSTTHGAEMASLGAFVATLDFYKKNNVIQSIWNYGYNLKNIFNSLSEEFGLTEFLRMEGISCSPYYICLDENKNSSNEFKTLLMQEMVKHNILWPSFISICYRHNNSNLRFTKKALLKAFRVYQLALRNGVKKYLKGNAIKPVFRKYN